MKFLRLIILVIASLIIIPFSSCESEEDYIDKKLVGSWYMDYYFEGYKMEITFYKSGKFKEYLYDNYSYEPIVANGTYKCSGYFLDLFYDYNENFVYRYDVSGDKLYISGTDGTISLTRKQDFTYLTI